MPMAIHMDGGSLFSYYETLPAMSECRPPPHSSSLRYRFRSRKQDVRHPTHFQVQGTGFSAHIPAHSLTSFFSSVHIEFPTKDLLVSHGPDGATGHARVCASYWLVLVLYIGHLFTFKVLVSTQNLYSLPTFWPWFQDIFPLKMSFLLSTQISGFSVGPKSGKRLFLTLLTQVHLFIWNPCSVCPLLWNRFAHDHYF